MSVNATKKIIAAVLEGGPLIRRRKSQVASCAPVALPAVAHCHRRYLTFNLEVKGWEL